MYMFVANNIEIFWDKFCIWRIDADAFNIIMFTYLIESSNIWKILVLNMTN